MLSVEDVRKHDVFSPAVTPESVTFGQQKAVLMHSQIVLQHAQINLLRQLGLLTSMLAFGALACFQIYRLCLFGSNIHEFVFIWGH